MENEKENMSDKAKLKKRLWNLESKYLRLKYNICQCCVRDYSTEVHHIIRRGQSNALYFDERNLLVLCHKCHNMLDPRNNLYNRFDILEINEIIKRVKGDDILEYLQERKHVIKNYATYELQEMIIDYRQRVKELINA